MNQHRHHPVVVVGGGLAGLTAAVALAAARVPVLLLEQKPTAGGRARSYVDTVTGDEIDNGQHLLIAGYTHTLGFLDAIGTRHLVDVQTQPLLRFHHPLRGFVALSLPPLPSPLHAVAGILRSDLLDWSGRIALLRGGSALRAGPADAGAGMTISQWLDAHHQPAEVRRCLWDPLAVAIMNERADRASARLFISALRQAFFKDRGGAALVFPRAGLSRLFAEPAMKRIRQSGGEVRCNTRVTSVVIESGRVTGIALSNGSHIPCATAIVAVPPAQLASMIPGDSIPGLAALANAEATPILGIHLWMTGEIMKHHALGVIGRRIQWVFRREHHLSLVISAAREFVGCSNAEITTLAVEDLRAVFGHGVGEPVRSVVIREKNATCSLTPEIAEVRPKTATTVANLFVCGDWTDTELPATIEGAILSGTRAAHHAIASLRLN